MQKIWAILALVLTLASLWGVSWLGHALQVLWPVTNLSGILTTWWTFPLFITIGLLFNLFVNSLTHIAKLFKGKKP